MAGRMPWKRQATLGARGPGGGLTEVWPTPCPELALLWEGREDGHQPPNGTPCPARPLTLSPPGNSACAPPTGQAGPRWAPGTRACARLKDTRWPVLSLATALPAAGRSADGPPASGDGSSQPLWAGGPGHSQARAGGKAQSSIWTVYETHEGWTGHAGRLEVPTTEPLAKG